jgi:hypothetical protein
MTNSVPILQADGNPVLDQYQQDCVSLLTDALEEAVKGNITSLCMVLCMNEGIATVMAGKNGTALNIGCDDLKHKIHASMFHDGNMARKKSSILRNGHG